MKKLLAVTIAITALLLLGADFRNDYKETRDGWPACAADSGPAVYRGYVLAIINGDEIAINMYQTTKKCGAFGSITVRGKTLLWRRRTYVVS